MNTRIELVRFDLFRWYILRQRTSFAFQLFAAGFQRIRSAEKILRFHNFSGTLQIRSKIAEYQSYKYRGVMRNCSWKREILRIQLCIFLNIIQIVFDKLQNLHVFPKIIVVVNTLLFNCVPL
ncbi:Hypothetical_protein [Hexamita inflata]|uniref:Hypothetical_protein n=1 Tax=Hexamita inflata TaxID=28002 RepID=A0AA86P9Y8_9EUKA|nr:Hypothetical protein HINF_LOCUS22506 [Hexamita inflata]CAI9934864.1 Hypothetical protein HINF_LOCUS22509 [Hexamita inflata]